MVTTFSNSISPGRGAGGASACRRGRRGGGRPGAAGGGEGSRRGGRRRPAAALAAAARALAAAAWRSCFPSRCRMGIGLVGASGATPTTPHRFSCAVVLECQVGVWASAYLFSYFIYLFVCIFQLVHI